MKRVWIGSLLLFVALLVAGPAVAADDPGQLLDFARHLYDQGDYFRAVTEAKRFVYLYPDDPRTWDARALAARSYLEAGRYEEARDEYLPLTERLDRPELVREALLGLGRALEVIDPEAAEGYYRDLGDETQLPPSIAATVQNRARYRLGWLRLENGQWDQAAQAFELVNAPRDLAFSAAELARAAPQGDQLPSRSPAAAAAMSAVLPGAGQLYVGRPVDAALAFGLNAAFITGTVAAAQDENWPVFALLGIIEVVWYGGNLYNAVNGAHRYNQDQKDAFLKELRRDHGFRLGYSPARKGVFAAWSIRF